MRYLVLSLFVPLSACTASRGYFAETEVEQVTVGMSVFEVRVKGNLAEATRINPQYAPRLGPLRTQAAQAMAEVSGCRVTGVLGDQALMIGVLNCPALGG